MQVARKISGHARKLRHLHIGAPTLTPASDLDQVASHSPLMVLLESSKTSYSPSLYLRTTSFLADTGTRTDVLGARIAAAEVWLLIICIFA